MKDTVLKLQTSRLMSSSDDENAVYAVTTHKNKDHMCRFLGIYKGMSELVKEAAAKTYGLKKNDIELIIINSSDYIAVYTQI